LGKYSALDSLIKVIAAVLLISTAGAFIAALAHTPISSVPAAPVDFTPWSGAGLAFLIALMGWMPTAVDLSTWNSIWTLERIKQTGYHPPLKDTLREFNFGFIFSAVLALMFLGLGALLFYSNSVEFPKGTAAFASGVVQLYTEAIGSWSWWIIATAAFSAMLGTCIACLDGYARSLARSLATLKSTPTPVDIRHERGSLILVALGALSLILLFPNDIRILVDLATTLSFLVAPLVAAANLYLVTRKQFPEDARPPRWMVALSWMGLAFLTGFSGLFFLS
jgi:Mn2+/Fe2+ NRAMP family transporter